MRIAISLRGDDGGFESETTQPESIAEDHDPHGELQSFTIREGAMRIVRNVTFVAFCAFLLCLSPQAQGRTWNQCDDLNIGYYGPEFHAYCGCFTQECEDYVDAVGFAYDALDYCYEYCEVENHDPCGVPYCGLMNFYANLDSAECYCFPICMDCSCAC